MDKDELHKELEAVEHLLKDIVSDIAKAKGEKELARALRRNRLCLLYVNEVITKLVEE